MKLLKIDEQGYFIEDVIKDKRPMIQEIRTDEDGTEYTVDVPDPQYIMTPAPGGLYRPRWDGEKWIDGKVFTAEDLDALKLVKRKQIKQACYEAIVSGFESSVKYGEPRHYSLDEFSQKNIDDQMAQLQAGEIANALWHDDSTVKHDVWTFEKFKAFFVEKQMFILTQRLKSDTLEERVVNATTKEEVDAINWDTVLTPEEQSENQSLVDAMFTTAG